MIISEIVIKRHEGCLFSDISNESKDFLLFSCLLEVDESYYTVLLVPWLKHAPEGELVDKIRYFVASLIEHPLLEDFDVIDHPFIPIFSVKVHDRGHVEGVIRCIMDTKDADFPV